MVNLRRVLGVFITLILSVSAFAGDIEVKGAWSRATAPGQQSGMADFTITSDKAATLVSVSSTVAKAAELHTMTHEDGMMKMREVKAIKLEAGKPLNLGESGFHVMLLDLKGALKAGDKIPLTLIVRTSGKHEVKVEVSAEVRPINQSNPPKQSEEHDHMHMNH